MFTKYVEYIMRTRARFERLPGKRYFGSIRGFQGVWAEASTQKQCAAELREVLEEWLLVKIRKQQFVPTTRKFDLNALLTA
ncbi:type II toxin-antitoxin system HicB family antitoxin [Candidatus Peregrinibacteria bacterium]|nr:type II toxin-antitoxin system HicB family antitoxin [Candidatus Peregrinibacteria bacterium]